MKWGVAEKRKGYGRAARKAIQRATDVEVTITAATTLHTVVNCSGQGLWQKNGSYSWLQRDDMSWLSPRSAALLSFFSHTHVRSFHYMPPPCQTADIILAGPHSVLTLSHAPAFLGRWYYWGVCSGGWKWGNVLGIECRLHRKLVSHLPLTQVNFWDTHRDTHIFGMGKKWIVVCKWV